ncbi:uncharacterized protein LOC144196637 [Stigmatopora nigra]
MDLVKERKWSKLRGRLYDLGYDKYLGAESVPLVQELFSDLVHTTESLRDSQRSMGKLEKESQNSDVHLAHENQDLHVELRMVRDEKTHLTKELKGYIAKLALQKSLNKDYIHKIQCLEEECNEKARIVQQLTSHAESSPNDDPYESDLVQSEPTKLKLELGNTHEQIQLLNNQIDELFQTNHNLEQELNAVKQKSSSKVMELTSKNHELCQEIMDIRNLAEMMEMEKKQKLKAANIEVEDLKVIIRKHQEVIQELEDQLGRKQTTPALPDIEFKAQPVTGDHQESNREKLEEMVDFLAAEKNRLQDKLQKMMALEKVLVLELEGWRAKYGVCGRDRSPSRLDAFVKSLEEERDQYRLEAQHYRNTLFSGNSLERKKSHEIEGVQEEPDEIRELKDELRQVEKNLQQVTKEKVSLMEELNLQFEQHTSEMIQLQMQLRKANEKIQQMESEKESQMVELRQKQLKQATASAEILKLKEALRLAKGVTEETPMMAVDPLMEELKYMQQQHEKQIAVSSGEIVQLEQKLQRAKEKIQELEELKTQNSETSGEILTLRVNLKRAEQKVQQVNCEKDLVKEEFKHQKRQQEHRISNALADISDLKQKLRVSEAKIQQLTLKNDWQMEEFQKNEKHSKASAEMFTLKEKIKMTEDTLEKLKSEKERQMEELEKLQLNRDEQQLKTSAEILKLEEKIRLSEEQIKPRKDEKDSLMEQLKRVEQSSNVTAEVLKLKLELREVNKNFHQLTSEKDLLTDEMKKIQLQKDRFTMRTSTEMENLMENIQLSEGKIKEVMKERDSFMMELEDKNVSIISDEISNLKENLKLKDENIQQLTEEKEAQISELKKTIGSITTDKISQLKEELRLAEEKIQQLIEEKHSKVEKYKYQNSPESAEVHQLKEKLRLAEEKNFEKQSKDQTLTESVEVLHLKEKLRLTEEKIHLLTNEKDRLAEQLKQKTSSDTWSEISNLKEKLRLAEEKIQRLMEERDSQQAEWKKKQQQRDTLSANKFTEILKLREKLKLAEEKIQHLTEEKDTQQVEWEREQLPHNNQSVTKPSESLKEKLRQKEQQVQQMLAENKSLLEEMKKFRLTEEKIQKVTAEKDSLIEQLQLKMDSNRLNASEELRKLQEMVKMADGKLTQMLAGKALLEEDLKTGGDQHSNTSAEILQLKQKLKLVEEKIQQLTVEKDSLREELRCGPTSVMPYEGGRDTRVGDTQDVVYNLKQENLELREQVLVLREQNLALRDRERDVEHQMDARSAALVWNDEESARQRKTASSLRPHKEQIQNSLLDLQQMLYVKTDELHNAHDQMKKLEDTIESLSQELNQQKQNAKVFELSYSALCIQKDVLQDEAAKKSKSLALLKEQLSKKEMTTQKMLENHQETLGRLKRDKELIVGENQKLKDDMAKEKEASSHERDELKQKLARMGNFLNTKDRENLELLDRFRKTRLELQEQEYQLVCAQDVIGSMSQGLLSSEKERQNLCETLEQKEREVKELLDDLQGYKAQEQGQSQMEAELRALRDENGILLADLATVRVKMDSDKEIARVELLKMKMELVRANVRHEVTLSEVGVLEKHLASEKVRIGNIEAMMSEACHEASTKEAELGRLRHKLSEADKTMSQQKDMSFLLGKVTELQSQIEILPSKILECQGHPSTFSQDISFEPPRASSPIDHAPIPGEPPPDNLIQEELSFGPT